MRGEWETGNGAPRAGLARLNVLTLVEGGMWRSPSKPGFVGPCGCQEA